MNSKPRRDVPIDNLDSAHFDCVFPTCGGICCRNGRPGVEPEEATRIERNLKRFLPHLTERARKLLERRPFLTRRVKEGLPTLAVDDGWCVFHNAGCVLHKVGAAEGDKYRYKPAACVLFPLTRDKRRGWYVRQHGLRGEAWDLFCLNPQESPKVAADSLADEVAYLERRERRRR